MIYHQLFWGKLFLMGVISSALSLINCCVVVAPPSGWYYNNKQLLGGHKDGVFKTNVIVHAAC